MKTPKKRPVGRPRKPYPQPNRRGKPINVWVPNSVFNALMRYVDSLRPRVTKTAAVEMMLIESLITKGFIPDEKEDDVELQESEDAPNRD